MKTIQGRAQKIRERYHVREPRDIERVMNGENLYVVRFPFPGRVQEMIVANWVGIQSSVKDMRRVHELLAHALGHHLLHAGNQPFYHFDHDRVIAFQWEHQAWQFAFELLMPLKSVAEALHACSGEEELRDHYQVSDEFFQMRMLAFKEESSRVTAPSRRSRSKMDG